MTPDTALGPTEPTTIDPPSTAGMTTKVVKGSIWTLAGSVLPLAVAFVATPYTIRFLGTEAYGLLLLVGLIPTYFSFADFGMGIASTKFASEAFGEGNHKKERASVWTATAIATIPALIIALPIFVFSTPILRVFNVPEHILTQGSIALKITSAAFVLGILASVLNSPMLARLRMDMNTLTQAGPKILLAAVTPFILYFGGGIVGAVSWSLIVAVAALAVVIYFSGRLLPGLFKPTFDRNLVRPLMRFGGAWFVGMIAAMLLVNLEKFFLTEMVSVEALAYYSVAFTLANMATMFSQAMIQSIVPAFSQMQTPEKRTEYNVLFARTIRLNIIWLLPALMAMFVIAKPFLTLWLGEAFGRESTPPFYVLLAGLFFNILAYIPHASITAAGRTDIFARLYWIELALYAILAWVLIGYFGIVGAAAAWTIRVILDAFAIIAFSKKVAHTEFRFFSHFGVLGAALVLLSIPVVLTILSYPLPLLIGCAVIAGTLYCFLIWKWFVDADEKRWISNRVSRLLDSYR